MVSKLEKYLKSLSQKDKERIKNKIEEIEASGIASPGIKKL